jgi:hypothetical protein
LWSTARDDQCVVCWCREGSPKTKAEQDAAAKAALEAFHLCPNLEILVPALLEGGPGELQRRCSLTPGGMIPLTALSYQAVSGELSWLQKCLVHVPTCSHCSRK